MQHVQPASFDSWSEALAGHFFSDRAAGRPVYFQTDEDALAEIGTVLGVVGSAVDSLTVANRNRLRVDEREPLASLKSATRLWRNKADRVGIPPPFLPLLAICVLAATQMQRDAANEIASTNYYRRLNDLLGVSGYQRPRGFEDVQEFWLELNRWLDEDNRGSRGLATATPLGRLTHIGWPISQALLRAADRAKLAHFFQQCDVPPGSDIDPSDILPLLSAWAAQDNCPLSSWPRTLVRSGGDSARQVAELVAAEARSWDGAVEDAGITSCSFTISLAFGRGGRPRTALLYPHRPRGFPETPSRWSGPTGDLELTPTPGTDRYEPIGPPEADFARTLESGFVLRDRRRGLAIEWKPTPIVVLEHDLELGGIASRSQVTLRQPCAILCADRLLPEVEAVLRLHAAPGWQRHRAQLPLPANWSVIFDVRVCSRPNGLSDDLRPLVPAGWSILRLDGGLKLDASTWLSGNEPTLVFTAAQPTRTVVTLDDIELVEVTDSSVAVSLADHAVPPGEHCLTVSTGTVDTGFVRKRRFTTVRSGDFPPSIGVEPLRHPLRRTGDHYRALGIAAVATGDGPPPPGTIWIEGSRIDGARDDLPDNLPNAIELAGGARHYVLLGARPGMIDVFVDPAAPAYRGLRRPDFPAAPFTVVPAFRAVWAIRVSWGGNKSVQLVGEPEPPDPLVWDASRADEWTQRLRKSYRRRNPRPWHSQALWDQYAAFARSR